MSLENQHFSVYAGDSHELVVLIDDQDTGKALNLAGAEFTWILYREPHHAVLLTKTSEASQIQILNASEGSVQVDLTSADTALLKFGSQYSHALKVRDSAGKVVTVTTGNCNIKK